MTLSLSETINTGITHLQNNNFDKAEQLFQAVLHLQRNNLDALHLLGVLRLKQGKRAEAVEFLENAIEQGLLALELDPSNSQLHLLLAYVYIDLQQWASAESAFKQALQLNSDLIEAYAGLGSIYYNHGQLQRAYSMFYQALKKDQGNIEVLYHQGIVLRSLGELAEAELILSKAVALAPSHVLAWSSLGLTLQELDRQKEAKLAYETVLKLDAENGFASHMLAALGGKTSLKAPQQFVSELFDAYAPAYEEHLQTTLEFQAPSLIAAELQTHCAAGFPFEDVLDLGCGTGLMAEQLQGKAKAIDGVDLSQKMLNLANNKGLYRSLALGDISDFLEKSIPAAYDCCLASDVFIYSGDLTAMFKGVSKVLKKEGVFVLTTENFVGKDYSLLANGRYAHAISYIQKLSKECNFIMQSHKVIPLRKENETWLDGCVYLLSKTE